MEDSEKTSAVSFSCPEMTLHWQGFEFREKSVGCSFFSSSVLETPLLSEEPLGTILSTFWWAVSGWAPSPAIARLHGLTPQRVPELHPALVTALCSYFPDKDFSFTDCSCVSFGTNHSFTVTVMTEIVRRFVYVPLKLVRHLSVKWLGLRHES